ncbi:hypothetical protein D9M70_605980 [compost metagenome]
MVVRSLPPSHFSGPDVADLAVMGVLVSFTSLVAIVLDLRVEGSEEPADDLIRIGVLT